MTGFARGVLMVSALTFGAFGAWGFADPVGLVGLVEISLPTGNARADARAQYGGFTLGMGLFLLLCFARREWTAPGLAASAICLSLFAAARAAAVLTGAALAPSLWFLMAFEAAGAALSLVAWRMASRTPPAR